MKRCGWVNLENPLYVRYHDTEWGVPVHDDRVLYEFLVLEGAQAGLSWETVLKKRENYRKAFDGFDYRKIALYKEDKTNELLSDPGIIRNRLKILSAVRNAVSFMKIIDEFGSFDSYLWKYAGFKPVRSSVTSFKELPAKTHLSDIISADLKKRGMNFVGSTIIYAYLQAVGVVNDHETGCFCYAKQ